MHVAVLLFRNKWISWLFFAEGQCLQLQMFHPIEGVAPAGLQSPQQGTSWIGYIAPGPEITWLLLASICLRLSQNSEGVDTWQPLFRGVCVRHCQNTSRQALWMWTSVHHSFWSLLFPNFSQGKAHQLPIKPLRKLSLQLTLLIL